MSEPTSIFPFRQVDEVDDPLTALAREGARRILAEALAAEADAFVASFAEARLEDGRRRVVRHGSGPERAIQTGVGPIPVRRPKVRDRDPGAAEPVRFTLGDPAALGAADPAASMRFCPSSTCAGSRRATSARRWRRCWAATPRTSPPSVIGRLKADWEADYERWQRRDLSARRYVYVWADGVYLQARMEPVAECMLVLIGATPEGRKELVGFQVGVRESAQSWRELLVDIKSSRARHRARDRGRRRGHGLLEGPGRSVPRRPSSTVLGAQDDERTQQGPSVGAARHEGRPARGPRRP